MLPRTALLLALSSLLWPADAQAPQSALPPGTQQPGSVNGASAAPRTVRGRVQRRIGIGGAQATQNAPLATTPEPAYTGMGSLTNNQIIFDTWNGGNSSTDDGDRVEQLGVSGSSVISGSLIDLGDGSQSSYSGLNYLISGIAVDTAKGEYFAAVDNNSPTYDLTIQEGSLSGTGGLTKVFTIPLPDADDPNNTGTFAILEGLAIDAQTNTLYYAQAAENAETGDTVVADTGIYKATINADGSIANPTLLTQTSAGLVNPDYLVIDSADNLAFFTDSIVAGFGFPATDNLDEVNLLTGHVTVLIENYFATSDQNDLMQGLAINGHTLYMATVDYSDNTSTNNAIVAIPFTVTGTGSAATATAGTPTKLYSGTGADQPVDIKIDAAHGIFYTTGEQFVTTGEYYGAVYEGSLNGGSSLNEVLSMSTIVTNGDAAQDTDPTQLVLLTQPTVSASGTATAISGGSAVTVDSGVTVADADGQNLASATVSIASGAGTGDMLSFTSQDGITGSFSSGTLTLSGNASPADYQSALDSVTFSTTSASATARTLDWAVSDGVVSSATATSTVDVHIAPTVTAGATVTFDSGGNPVALDSGLTVTDASSSTLISATVSIASGFGSGDTLNFINQNGITGSFGAGVLTLTGTSSLLNYQAALDSVTFSTTSTSTTSRTIDWTVSDGVTSSNTVTSTVDVLLPPAITSAGSTTFTVGSSGSFTVTASGYPSPTFSETGALPSGVTLNSAGVLSGTPAAGTGGTYPLTITASNGIGTNATQSFTLTVNQAPAVTSASSTTFTTGTAGSFTVTASGYPAPTFSETGILPTGVSMTSSGVLSGIPAAGTGGTYPLTITASNGVGSPATQSFTLTVDQSPAITSASSATFAAGSAGSFTVTTSGYPKSAISETGVLPSGVTLVDNGNSTATLSGTPAAGAGGTYRVTITAGNGVSPNATQSFTLTVDQSPAITSAPSTTYTTGAAGSFTVTASGYPAPTFSETGILPTGVTMSSNGTLSGTPAAGTGGTYPLTITASNGVGTNATQSFTLTVDQAPAITSAGSTTFTTGAAGSFTVTTSAYPSPALSETGALPSGV
ncbi:MAG: putative Ig domain-containing protein, partial [Terracidiphilus sp.]